MKRKSTKKPPNTVHRGPDDARMKLPMGAAHRHITAEAVNAAAFKGERVVLTRYGKPVAALVSLADLAQLEGSAKTLSGPDFAAVLADVRLAGARDPEPSAQEQM